MKILLSVGVCIPDRPQCQNEKYDVQHIVVHTKSQAHDKPRRNSRVSQIYVNSGRFPAGCVNFGVYMRDVRAQLL